MPVDASGSDPGRRDGLSTAGAREVRVPDGAAPLNHLRLPTGGRQFAWSGAFHSPPAAGRRLVTRQASAEALGIAGLLAYNWWVLVPLRPGLMSSPSELFSDLEVPGRPFAATMQHADLLSGLLVLSAFAILGSKTIKRGRAEWWSIMVFATASVVASLFPEACPDGTSAMCRHLEWTFALPVHHYIHIVASVFEFGGVTAALWFAYLRTRGRDSKSALGYRLFTTAFLPAYLVLGAAYLFNVWGGVMEAVFFTAFTAIVVMELFERTGRSAPSSIVAGTGDHDVRSRSRSGGPVAL